MVGSRDYGYGAVLELQFAVLWTLKTLYVPAEALPPPSCATFAYLYVE